MRKIMHALALGVGHLAMLLVAHGIATHGAEIAALARDEWLLDAADHAIELAIGR
jgi:predicted DNA repair protein MutK